jgi:lauroyl/myristoyl acyltransferase
MTDIVSVQDLRTILLYSGICPLAWSLPEKYYPTVAHEFAEVVVRLSRRRAQRLCRNRELVDNRNPPEETNAFYTRYIVNHILEKFFLLRCHHPDGWHPEVSVKGRKHIERALTLGKGVILWVVPFRFSSLVTKIAIRREGFRVSHLSLYSHPGSGTAIGCTMLNPIRTKIECRYLAERVIIDRNGMVGRASPLDALSSRLQENKVVSVTVGMTGRRRANIPFLDGQICLATGPAYLAIKSSAPIIPVFTLRHSTGEFSTIVDTELRGTLNKNMDAQIEEMLVDFSTRLEGYVLRWPDQFPWNAFSSFES